MDEQAAVEKENVLIRAGSCVLSVLPALGGKIASIAFNGHELLQRPLAPYAARSTTMSFDASDASGWDECLPSVAACEVAVESGLASIPDHGDLWRVAWQPLAIKTDSVALKGQCFSLPLTLERAISLSTHGVITRLSLAYTLTNTANTPMPWSWAAHPLFAVEAGDRIVLPASIPAVRVEGSGGNRLAGSRVAWPLAVLTGGGTADLSIAHGPDSAIGDKLFAGPLANHENWCVLERRNLGLRIKVGFNPEATPYLGLWLCYGGWPEASGPKQMCVALEPATAPTDSLASTGPWSRVLAPGESSFWPMTVELSNL